MYATVVCLDQGFCSRTPVQTSKPRTACSQSFSCYLKRLENNLASEESVAKVFCLSAVSTLADGCVKEMCVGCLFLKWQLDLSQTAWKMHRSHFIRESYFLNEYSPAKEPMGDPLFLKFCRCSTPHFCNHCLIFEEFKD